MVKLIRKKKYNLGINELRKSATKTATAPVDKLTDAQREWKWKVEDAARTLEDNMKVNGDKKLFTAATKLLEERKKNIEEVLETTKFIPSMYVATEDFKLGNTEVKKGQELHLVLGVVLEPDTVDATTTEKSAGDIYNEEEVRKMIGEISITYLS